ncbi:MAG TPA: TolC family protein, partial [Vicinamibacterales bacterium]|nr:TolC family protein [Vicinamibacterales bacterium]
PMQLLFAVILVLIAPLGAQAQPAPAPPPVAFTLDRAVQYAVEHYPTVRAALEQVEASTAGVTVARAGYLPRLDSLWQSNRATANNIFGQVFPQSVIPSMSGPVLPSASAGSVWGSAAGALFSWEPFDFGLREATVAGAEAAVTRARASETLTRLEVQSAVGAAFLGVVAAQRAVVAAQADVDRRDTLARIVHTLVDNQLRPGAEGSRIDAERAAASTRLIQAQATLTLAQTLLARVLGVRSTVTVDAAGLLEQMPASEPNEAAAATHPLAQVHQAAVDVAKAQEDVLAHTDRPRLYLQSSLFARGSGANPDGQLDGSLSGLGLDRANWAAGVQIVFPNLFDFATLRARKAGAAAVERAESALYEEATLTITSQQQAAAAMLLASRAVAANTPVQLAAAQQSESQARARYQAGLASIVEVADTQSLLAQAEYQDQIARVDVWRALLAEAVARGSLTPFLALLHPPGDR